MPKNVQDLFPSKAIAAFDAVMQLVQQGVPLYQITVQQIANTAGIGKGTLYEYFSSREEMLAKAVIYYMWQSVCGLENEVNSQTGYQHKLLALLSFVQQAITTHSSPFPLIASSLHEQGMQTAIKALTKDRQELEERIFVLMNEIADEGRKEGKVGDVSPQYVHLVLNSLLCSSITLCNTNRCNLEDLKNDAVMAITKALA